MKKLIIVAAVAAVMFSSFNSAAQVKQYNFDLSAFNSIVVGGEFDVTIDHGDAYQAKITVEEPYREYVVCEIHGQVLSIGIDEKKVPSDVKRLYKGKGATIPVFKAVVTTPDNLSSIILEDNSSLSSIVNFNVESFTVKVSDNATLKALVVKTISATINTDKRAVASLNLNTETLNLEVGGNSTLNLTQSSKTIDAKISGFSSFTMHGDSENMDFSCKGNSKAIMNGTIPTVRYTLNGGCNVNAQAVICDDAIVKMTSVCTLCEAASKSLEVDLSGGATLIYDNTPAITVEDIKSSNMRKYSSTVKK